MNDKKRQVSKWLVAQFGRPSGFWGSVAGTVMAHRRSNRERARDTVELLDLRPGDRVLEIGFGPGVAIQRIAELGGDVSVVGIDHSAVMLRQASRRNARAIEEGRVSLRLACVQELPPFEERFHKIFAINSVDFWDDPAERLEHLRRELLLPGGRLVLTVQPRGAADTDRAVEKARDRLVGYLNRAGFAETASEMRTPGGAPAVVVWGTSKI